MSLLLKLATNTSNCYKVVSKENVYDTVHEAYRLADVCRYYDRDSNILVCSDTVFVSY